MELKKLERSVLKLWYIRTSISAALIIAAYSALLIILKTANAPSDVFLAILLTTGILVLFVLALLLILPYLKYKLFAWGYDDKTIVVKQGVIFRERVVIPVCQIQDLHRSQGPIMMTLNLSDVTISTAGSNFVLSTLTTTNADKLIDELENSLEVRIKEQENEKI